MVEVKEMYYAVEVKVIVRCISRKQGLESEVVKVIVRCIGRRQFKEMYQL